MLISLLTWTGGPLGALFGLYGWLPFEQRRKKIVRPMSPSEDSCAEEERTEEKTNLPAEAIAWLRKKFILPIEQSSSGSTSLPFQHTNLNLFHGHEDVVVNMELGEQARICLASLGSIVRIPSLRPPVLGADAKRTGKRIGGVHYQLDGEVLRDGYRLRRGGRRRYGCPNYGGRARE